MFDLNGKTEERLKTSRPGDEIIRREYSGLAFDDTDPLPSMFRKLPARGDTAAATDDTQSRSRTQSVKAGFYLYLIAYFLFMAAGACALLAPQAISFDRAALEPAAVSPDQSRAGITTLFSINSAEVEKSQSRSIPPAQPSLAEGESWSETVETVKRLFTGRKPSQVDAWEVRIL
jgi:hypothetical protein